MRDYAKEIKDDFIKENSTNTFSGWPMSWVVGYYQQFYHPHMNEAQIEAAITDACNELRAAPSKSSCIALRASELNLPHVDVSGSELPRVERFSDLPDGTLFYLAQTYAYGGRQKYQKTLEDGGLHNAVLYTESYSGIRVPDTKLVIRVGDKA